MIKRYDTGRECRGNIGTPAITEQPEGAYVLYDDYAAVFDELRAEKAGLEAIVAGQAGEIGRLWEAQKLPMDKPSTWPLSAAQFETAAELIAMELAERDGHEGDDKHRLIWEGSPPEPWGEVWQRYIPDAQTLLSAGIAGIQDEERRGLAADAARAALSGESNG